MRELIISNGLAKRAADEGGPDLETQFGILTAGELSARHPKLDAMRLAFQVRTAPATWSASWSTSSAGPWSWSRRSSSGTASPPAR